MTNALTADDVINAIFDEIGRAGSMRALAAEWSVSPTLISKVVNREQAPGPKILGPLGLERVKTVVYREKQS